MGHESSQRCRYSFSDDDDGNEMKLMRKVSERVWCICERLRYCEEAKRNKKSITLLKWVKVVHFIWCGRWMGRFCLFCYLLPLPASLNYVEEYNSLFVQFLCQFIALKEIIKLSIWFGIIITSPSFAWESRRRFFCQKKVEDSIINEQHYSVCWVLSAKDEQKYTHIGNILFSRNTIKIRKCKVRLRCS